MPTAKNVLLITTDQHKADCLGFRGSPVKTPHLDRLAESGVTFTDCSTPSVVCQPARASILTGLLPREHGVTDNGYDLPEDVLRYAFSERMTKAGIRTAFLGKAHFSDGMTYAPTGTPECRFSSSDYGPDWNGPYMGFDHVELMTLGHYRKPPPKPPAGQHYERWYHLDGDADERNRLLLTNLEPSIAYTHLWYSALPSAFHNSSWLGDRAVEFIKQTRGDRFAAWISFPDPHVPFDCPEPWSRLHRPADVKLPPNRALYATERPSWYAEGLKVDVDSPEIQRLLPGYKSRLAPESEILMRHIIANYYGMIALIDHSIGRILNALREVGEHDNTLVVFTSDHGEWLGDHGLMTKGPMPFQSLLNVPLVCAGPGVPRRHVVTTPVTTLGIGGTLLDALGIATDDTEGNLAAHWSGRASRTEPIFSEWFVEPTPLYPMILDLVTVRQDSMKLSVDLRSGEYELYDLSNDPDENNNLRSSAHHAVIAKTLIDAARSNAETKGRRRLSRVGWA